MFYFLTDEKEKGKKYYKRFLENPFFEEFIDKYNYPKDINVLNKDYVMNMISDQRKFWHSKPSMKEMKIMEYYER